MSEDAAVLCSSPSHQQEERLSLSYLLGSDFCPQHVCCAEHQAAG